MSQLHLTNHPFFILSTVFIFSSSVSLFLLPFMNHLPISYLLLISHSNISSHLLLPRSLAIFLVSVPLSRLRLVLPHLLPLLLSLFSALFFQVPHTSPYLHFPLVVFSFPSDTSTFIAFLDFTSFTLLFHLSPRPIALYIFSSINSLFFSWVFSPFPITKFL